MCSDMNDCRLRQPGFPIRKSPDQSVFAAPRSLSQLTTSFIASYRQGIHLLPVTVCLPVSYNYLKRKLFTSRAVKCNYLFTRYDDELSKNEKFVVVETGNVITAGYENKRDYRKKQVVIL